MGICSSCFRRKKTSPEREPLLPKIAPLQAPPTPSHLEKAVDIIAAFQSGKLPSQSQLNSILRSLANSKLLQCEVQLGSGRGPLSANGRRVLVYVREVVEAALQVGMEKNGMFYCLCTVILARVLTIL